MRKTYYYKVYNKSGDFIKTWTSKDITSLPSFSAQIQGGYGNTSLNLALPFDDFDEGNSINVENLVEIYEQDGNALNGRLIYKGVISRYDPYINGSTEGVKIDLLGLVSFLSRDYFRDGNYVVNFEDTDPADMIRAILDHVDEVYPGIISYTVDSIEDVGSLESYQFVERSWIDAIDDAFALIGGGWYWHVDATGLFHLHPKPSSPTHTFVYKKNIAASSNLKSAEDIINVVWMKYSGGSVEYSDSASVALYGRRVRVVTDTNISDSSTALKRAQKELVDNKDLVAQAEHTINTQYDIETVKVGETCKIQNYKYSSSTFSENMQIAGLTYSPNSLKVNLENVSTFGTELLKVIKN